jgi:cobalt-zinc-cadmium efflux system membrane fusion protein
VIVAAMVLASCSKEQVKEQPKQATEKPEGLSVTHWTARTELFMEYPPLVAGVGGRFAVHLTRLDNFRPIKAGKVDVRLAGPGGTEIFSTPGPSRPGIFGVDVKPSKPGTYTATIQVQSADLDDSHDVGAVTVYADEASASNHPAAKQKEETIAFLKEQQWALDFATEPVSERTERSSFDVPGEVQLRTGGQSEVTAPIDGRLADAVAVIVGRAVTLGQVLAQIAPPVSAPSDRTTLEVAKTEAENNLAFARRDRERAQRLVDAGAVPARRLEEARLSETTIEIRLKAAETRLAQYEASRGAEGDGGSRLFSVRAPMTGTIVESHAVSGANIRAGDMLFRIVDTESVYVSANVPEAELVRLRQVTGAELQTPNSPATKPLGRQISVGRMIDPQSRTVPVLYEMNNSDRQLVVGQAVQIRLFTSPNTKAPAIRESAIVDDAGRPVVFVQLSGEAFARRPVTLGNRQGEYVQVATGVQPGERVVTKGAYLIRLSSMSSQIPAHGHVH